MTLQKLKFHAYFPARLVNVGGSGWDGRGECSRIARRAGMTIAIARPYQDILEQKSERFTSRIVLRAGVHRPIPASTARVSAFGIYQPNPGFSPAVHTVEIPALASVFVRILVNIPAITL